MGIDYVLDLTCTPKQEIGTERLVALVKARSRADAVLAMVRQGGDERPTGELHFDVVLRTRDGSQRRSVSVQSLYDEAAALEPERGHCTACAINHAPDGFGCYLTVPYPISEAAEEWLMSRLPKTLTCTAGMFLRRAVKDFEWNGQHAATMRGEGETFFESRIPFGIRWGDGDDRIELSSDQVFHMLFHVGHLSPTHCLMLCLFLGVLPHDLDAPILQAPGEIRKLLDAATVADPEVASAAPLAQFVRALARAARHEVSILIDG